MAEPRSIRRCFPAIHRLSLAESQILIINSSMPIRHRVMTMMMAFALFVAIGGPLAVLQGVAWVNMVHDFSQNGSLAQAMEKAFDGQHPCPLCKRIATQRASEEKVPVTLKVDKKAEAFVSVTGSMVPLPMVRPMIYGPAPFVSIPERFFAPPVPVPIVGLS